MSFITPSISIDGSPQIDWEFDNHQARARAFVATVLAEMQDDGSCMLLIVDTTGAILADIIVRKISRDESISVSLLWSHYRWQRAQGDSAVSV